MFTGIVQAAVPVVALVERPQLVTLTLELPERLCTGLAIGSSVAVNGTCLTITGFEGRLVHFDAMLETLRVTNLGRLAVGDRVNVERAARHGDEIGGHVLSGHVHALAEIIRIEWPENNHEVVFRAPAALMKYLLPKGFVALNGCSLTIGRVEGDTFDVWLIPETLRATTYGELQVGALVNLEIDAQTQAIVDTVERVLAERGLLAAAG